MTWNNGENENGERKKAKERKRNQWHREEEMKAKASKRNKRRKKRNMKWQSKKCGVMKINRKEMAKIINIINNENISNEKRRNDNNGSGNI